MSEWNIKTRLSSAFLIVRKLTKRQRLHLLTVSQRECKEITKTGFYFGLGSFLRFPLHSAHDSWSVTDVICLFHLVTERGGSALHSPRPQRLDLAQNTHLCFLGLHKCIWPSRCVQNNCLLLELLPCPLNLCEARMKGVALVFVSPVNYWYLPLLWLLSGWRWEMSPHNGHTAQTGFLSYGREEGRQEQNWNVLIVSLHLLFTTAVPQLIPVNLLLWPHLLLH